MNVRTVLPKDAIPSIDDPEFATEYPWLGEDVADGEVVVVDADDGPARAYPVRILHYHEIVNDEVDGRPVAVTWCPLCGSAVVYDRRVGDETLTFGVSGKLADDDLVMYDRETGSEWKQSLGDCIAGVHEGAELTVLPGAVTTYESFRKSHPQGLVLQPVDAESEAASDTDDPEPVDYDDAPYSDYFASEGFGLAAHRGEDDARMWDRDDDLDPKTVVLGVEHGDDAVGFPLTRVAAGGGTVAADVGGERVVVLAGDAGIHAYEHPGFEVRREDGRFRGDRTTWNAATGESTDGRRLARVPSRRLFAFAWQDDHGPDAFYVP
jgi:hypothetical protein